MPIGPSHGSRGGGSSFGGGSRSGGHRSSGGYSSSRRSSSSSSSGSSLGGAILGGIIYSLFANRHRRHYESAGEPVEDNGLPYRPRPTKYLVWAIVFAVFAAITMMIRGALVNTMTEYKNTLEIIRTDYEQSYKPMIDAVTGQTAPATGSVDCGNGYYKTIATFSKVKYTSYGANPTRTGAYLCVEDDNISYYFIVYSYVDMRTGEKMTGTTYAQFSASQVDGLNGKIEVAYHSKAGAESYSMNTSYTTYETAEYEHYEDVVEGNEDASLALIFVFVVELGLIALFIFIYIKKLKKYKALVAEDEAVFQQKQKAEATEAQAKAEEAQRIAKSKGRVCEYCGCDVPDGAHVCPGCGSRDFE